MCPSCNRLAIYEAACNCIMLHSFYATVNIIMHAATQFHIISCTRVHQSVSLSNKSLAENQKSSITSSIAL